MTVGSNSAIAALRASAYRIPTDAPEADGTLSWDATTLVIAEIEAGGRCGLGYTYADAAAAQLIATKLAPAISGSGALAIPAASHGAARACDKMSASRLIVAAGPAPPM